LTTGLAAAGALSAPSTTTTHQVDHVGVPALDPTTTTTVPATTSTTVEAKPIIQAPSVAPKSDAGSTTPDASSTKPVAVPAKPVPVPVKPVPVVQPVPAKATSPDGSTMTLPSSNSD